MVITRRLSEIGATEEAIQQLEKELGFQLPNDYKRFLAEFNGGHPEPSKFTFDTDDGQSDSSVRYFLTLDSSAKHYTCAGFLSEYSDRMPYGLLPIACDSFGNLILIDVGARTAGVVYFWDHEKENMEDPTWENIVFVASSFTEFVQTLQ